MSVSYNYDRNQHHQHHNQHYLPHQDSSSSYDQGYNSQPHPYSHSVTSDGFSDISFDPYNNKPPNYYGYSNNVFTPDDSRRQVFGVQRMPLNDGRQQLRDRAESEIYSQRTPSIISSVGRDADVESIASHQTHTTTTSYGSSVASTYDQYRYNGELYRPVAAPRKVNSQVKKLFGEIHPRMLRPEEKPIVESGEETEDSMISFDSSIIPRAAPRASMRMKNRSVQFIEDEAIRLENLRLKSILRRLNMPSKLDLNGYKLVVRFEHVDKYAENRNRRDITDYSDVDSDHGGRSRKQKNKQKDVWSHVGPVSLKPARNDSRKGSLRSSSNKSRPRSASADRSRNSQRSGSKRRSSSASSGSKRAQQSPTFSRKDSQKHAVPNDYVLSDDKNHVDQDYEGQVTINMPENDKKKPTGSMITDIRRNGGSSGMCSDSQKACKWALIIGVPSLLLIVVIVVIAVIFANQS